jgi:pilus assembly protein CpaE
MASEKVRVLIVDDVAETRENIRKLLQFESDVEVVGAARNGKEGIQFSQELDPDVVLMDINMPEMDGIEATRRGLKLCPGIDIIALSM